jgi:hypothetical protein
VKRKHTLTALATLTLILGLALTGCGSNDEGAKVASGGGAQPTGDASSAPASLSRGEMGVKFAQCLRENGLDVPDPEPGKGVLLKFDGSQNKQTVDKAMEACRQYDPQQQGGAAADPKMEENGRKFAACMRANGVEAFPDPKPGQRGILIDKKVGDDPDFQKAQEACQSILSGGPTLGAK